MESRTLLQFLYTIVPSEASDITLADHGAGFVDLRQTTATQTTTSTEWSPHHVFKLIKSAYNIIRQFDIVVKHHIVGPLPFLNPTSPPSFSMRRITSSNKIGAKSVCSTHTQ